MDFTAILSSLEELMTGTMGILLIAAAGVAGIFGAHFFRMRFSRTKHDERSRSYRNVVIEPYEEDDGKDSIEAMMPNFPRNQEQF